MLQITPQMKVLVAVAPVDFRKGIDGLVAVCKLALEQAPFAGTVFVFRNPRHSNQASGVRRARLLDLSETLVGRTFPLVAIFRRSNDGNGRRIRTDRALFRRQSLSHIGCTSVASCQSDLT